MRILPAQPFDKDSHLNPLCSTSRRQGQVGKEVARRIDLTNREIRPVTRNAL